MTLGGPGRVGGTGTAQTQPNVQWSEGRSDPLDHGGLVWGIHTHAQLAVLEFANAEAR